MNIDLTYLSRCAKKAFSFAILLLLWSCVYVDDGGREDVHPYTSLVNVQVKLRILTPDDANNPVTRAVDTGPYKLTGTTAENGINTITLFLVKLDDGGNEIRTAMDYQTVFLGGSQLAANGDGSYTATIDLPTTLGNKHLYVGANMRATQISAFVSNQAYKSSATTQRGVLADVMDIDSDGNGSNILMFGAYNEDGSSAGPSTVSIASGASVIDLTGNSPVGLERLVSKVLLTFTQRTDFTGVGDSDSRTEEITFNDMFETDYTTTDYHGWSSLSDVKYILNTTNKQVYLERNNSKVEHSDANSKLDNITKYWNVDPNQAIGSFVAYNATSMDIEKESGYTDHFINYVSSDITYDETNNVPFASSMLSAQPLAYESAKLSNNGTVPANHQTAGLYCLENTVSNDFGDGSSWGGYTIDDVASYVSTHIVVAIRYIPKTFYVVSGNALSETTFATRAGAMAALPAYTDTDVNVTYPANTYWVNMTERKYYNSEAKKLAVTNGTDATKFIQIAGGYSYFRTFIDPLQHTSSGVLTYTNNATTVWGLDRNSYHILNVENITVPSMPNLTDYIRVNSISNLTWNNRGSTSQKVTPQ